MLIAHRSRTVSSSVCTHNTTLGPLNKFPLNLVRRRFTTMCPTIEIANVYRTILQHKLQIRAPDLRYEQAFCHSESLSLKKFTFAVESKVYNRQYKSPPTSRSSRCQASSCSNVFTHLLKTLASPEGNRCHIWRTAKWVQNPNGTIKAADPKHAQHLVCLIIYCVRQCGLVTPLEPAVEDALKNIS